MHQNNNGKLITHLINLSLDDSEINHKRVSYLRATLADFDGLCSALIFNAIFNSFSLKVWF